jgi:hypothetical protein
MEPYIVLGGLFLIGIVLYAYVEFSDRKHTPAHG